jgi:hypothetical protein
VLLFLELEIHTAAQCRAVLLHTGNVFLPAFPHLVLLVQLDGAETKIRLCAVHAEGDALSAGHSCESIRIIYRPASTGKRYLRPQNPLRQQ